MMQVIDEAYLRQIAALPDGFTRLLRMQCELLERAETAESIAKACIREIEPLRRQRDDLRAALNHEVQVRRDQRVELQAEIDALRGDVK